MKQVVVDPRGGGTRRVPDGNVQETVVARRHVPATPGPGRPREEKDLVRLLNGFWYFLATGLHDSSGATRIERA
ncbi:hypothetical protein [Streptomyces sp. NBC_00439]|uniref:hypothetical protein n=1 Tax=Streptomyces sp. NBC_00439 TaxID=2903650 RepID=UPI00224DB585|nr:hypothetical protein [Streptomyces sp. NBC_00439]MCX5103540.1 hypothetical protein [Streptomyces sp. NBC_00439]